ncbi:hypothetical protein ACFVYD_28420 [Streptomyces sp. NPDC058301]|uniref:hypothetical protein n=1 Tax=Streptomyces sp. NPDC058301 TaxID=3346436 RepID=UPI0036EEF359
MNQPTTAGGDESAAAPYLRLIRREEQYIAVQRSMAFLRRAELIRKPSQLLGSDGAVARGLGVTPQAISKTLAEDRARQDDML